MQIPTLTIGDLSFKLPIIQGGMGIGVSKSRLATAVSQEGGLGVISGVHIGFNEQGFSQHPLETNIATLRKEIQKVKRKNLTVGLNLMVAMNHYDTLVQVAVEEGIDVIISGAGLPLTLPKLVEGSNTKIIPIVSSQRALRVILRSWIGKYNRVPDAIICEGFQAGGHLGFSYDDLIHNTAMPLIDIVKEVKAYLNEQNLDVPIIAAGGIYTSKDIKLHLDNGASGVQMATRFVTTIECDASDEYKQAYIDCKKEDIEYMMSPVGLPGRAIMNPYLKKVIQAKETITKCTNCLRKCNPKTIQFCISQSLIHAAKGRVDSGLLFVGAKAYLADKISTVKEVMTQLQNELQLL